MDFEGGRELSAALKALGDEATVAGRRALRSTGNELRDEIKSAAPVGPGQHERYGHLRDNIRVREQRAQRDNTIVMAVTTGRAFWGNFLEFGTRKMAARPWMRPVFDRMHSRLIARLGDDLGTQIERAAKRIERRAKRASKG